MHNEIALMNAKDGFAGFKEIVIYDLLKNILKILQITFLS